jgi:hypothetical protein
LNALTTMRHDARSLAPANMGEAMQFAKMLADSSMVPKDFQGKPANCLIAIQWGYEVGLGPLQAVQNIAVINGRPAIWGDAALALVRAHPACVVIREGVEGEADARVGWCEVTRKGEGMQRRTFSVADAKRAGLWGKSGPWQQYPDRMLQLRARGFAIRDVFPDALRGVITAEEAQDTPQAEPMPPAKGPVIDAAAGFVPPPRNPWDGMSWPVCKRDGTCDDLADPDAWLEEIGKRVAHIQGLATLDAAQKTKAIRQIADANRVAWDDLRDRGYGSAVEEAEAILTAALGDGQ